MGPNQDGLAEKARFQDQSWLVLTILNEDEGGVGQKVKGFKFGG